MGIKFNSAGESHGKQLICIVEGLPAGLKVSSEFINADLKRRQSGYGRGDRMKIESDKVIFASGIRFGETMLSIPIFSANAARSSVAKQEVTEVIFSNWLFSASINP